MTLEALYLYCTALPGAEETYPFGPDVLVMKVGGKMFALIAPDEQPPRVNLKCEPERAVRLREEHAEVTPGYHMSKTQWNTVALTPTLRTDLVQSWVDHSYALVVRSLTKKKQAAIPGALEVGGDG
jgi:predicted DNA-binding protein (MmcQ/YjbR family)